MPIDTALHFTLLSGNDHSQENEENQIFEPIQTFKNNEDAVDFVDNGSIFDCLDNDGKLFENIDSKDDSDILSVLTEKLKTNGDFNNGLMLFNEDTVEVLRKLHVSFEKQEVSLSEPNDHSAIRSVGDIVGNLKFVQDVS